MASRVEARPPAALPVRATKAMSTAEDVAAQLLLTLTLALGAFVTTTSVALLAAGASEGTESALYVVAFTIVLPASVLAGTVLSRALRQNATLTAVAALWSAGLLALLILARLAYAAAGTSSLGSVAFLAGLLVWWGCGAAAIGAIASGRAIDRGLGRLRALAPGRLGAVASGRLRAVAPGRLLALPAALLAVLLLGFPPAELLQPKAVGAGVLVASALAAARLVLLRRPAPRRLGVVLDAVVVALALLTLNDLSLYREPAPFLASSGPIHQNFYLGPANVVAHGGAMLVDAFSQYGVGVFYLLGGWFRLADVGHGGLTLIASVATALQVTLAYGILRLARVSRPLALVGGLLAAIAAFFVDGLPILAWFPSTGGLRYLLPYLLIAAVLVAERAEERRRSLGLLAPAVLALASLWSIETFLYSLAAFAGIAAFRAAALGGGPRMLLRHVSMEAAPAAIAVVAAQVLFAILTRAGAGVWPDWSGYLDYIGAYTSGGPAGFKLPMEPWSPGLVIAAVYFASIAALVVLVARAPRLVREERLTLTAVAGCAPLGIAIFTYFLGRSLPPAALVIGTPSFLAIILWLGILERRRAAAPVTMRALAFILPFWAAGMMAVSAWPKIEARLPNSALAMALPDGGSGGSLRYEIRRMWHSPPLDPKVPPAERLLRRHFPGDGPVLVVAAEDTTTAILTEAGRVNALPVSHWVQDGLVPDRAWPPMQRALDELRPGALMLTERIVLKPRYPAGLLDLTVAALKRRFRFQVVDGDPQGVLVIRLVPKDRPAGEDPGTHGVDD